MKNKNLIMFIAIGFILTTCIWGFVGGCGRSNIPMGLRTLPPEEDKSSAEGVILEKGSIPGEGRVYIVERGDTLWGISKRFGVSVSKIKEINSLETDTISVGQRLVLPGVVEVKEEVKETIPPSPHIEPKPGLVTYKVRQNDSLWRIAQIYGTSVEHIAELNGLPTDAKLIPGQEILVPSD